MEQCVVCLTYLASKPPHFNVYPLLYEYCKGLLLSWTCKALEPNLIKESRTLLAYGVSKVLINFYVRAHSHKNHGMLFFPSFQVICWQYNLVVSQSAGWTKKVTKSLEERRATHKLCPFSQCQQIFKVESCVWLWLTCEGHERPIEYNFVHTKVYKIQFKQKLYRASQEAVNDKSWYSM